MIAFLVAAPVLVCMGAVMLQRASRHWSAGHAVAEEDELLRNKQPVQFTLFIAVEIVLGCVFVLGGTLLFIIAALHR